MTQMGIPADFATQEAILTELESQSFATSCFALCEWQIIVCIFQCRAPGCHFFAVTVTVGFYSSFDCKQLMPIKRKEQGPQADLQGVTVALARGVSGIPPSKFKHMSRPETNLTLITGRV
jgi:hypothetical protein